MDKQVFNIYIHTNITNGKVYVGQTCQKPERRWGFNGRNYLKKKDNQYVHFLFAPAILKYSWDGFEHKVIFTGLTKLEADMIEEDLIWYYKKINKSYNVTDKANATVMTDEHKRKISESLKGKNTWIKGRKFSEEEKEKRAKSHFKSVEQWLDNNLINAYKSIKDAANDLGICASSITEAAKGKRKTAGGFIWKYKEE